MKQLEVAACSNCSEEIIKAYQGIIAGHDQPQPQSVFKIKKCVYRIFVISCRTSKHVAHDIMVPSGKQAN